MISHPSPPARHFCSYCVLLFNGLATDEIPTDFLHTKKAQTKMVCALILILLAL